jgi:hypothetical protein
VTLAKLIVQHGNKAKNRLSTADEAGQEGWRGKAA